ncbi:MAG: RNA polymerase sigma factor SigZ [Aquabacterium sp.]|uniref:RNA polymerase sigma factor SigZ n=1 Tax=Aquabacterium sp. TaxID=1872578 RepID=UPI003BDC58E3
MSETGEWPCLMRAWHAHERELHAWLVNRLDDTTLARDILQDVFIKALRMGGQFCDVANARAWLFEVTRHALTDQWRKQRPTEVLDDALPEPDQDQPAAVDSLASCLPRVLAELSEADRDAITQCDLHGMSQEAYAQRMGITLAGAKSRVQRARRRLKSQLMASCRIVLDEHGSVCCFTPRQHA